MRDIYGFDSYSPQEIAERVQGLGLAKVRLPLLKTVLLGMLAGAFIGLGALFSTLVLSDSSLGFAASRLAGGVCFSMGLLMVVVAGAELFTGNNLLAMAWASGTISTAELLRNWVVICAANLAGAAGLALLVFLAGQGELNDGAVGQAYLKIAASKAALEPLQAFFRGVLCNVLVCMAVWMAMSGRNVTDRFIAIVLPITAFVAAGFEHSVANMYYFPMALLLQASGMPAPGGAELVTVAGMFSNLGIVIAGNLAGGSVLVALVYWVIYLRAERSPAD